MFEIKIMLGLCLQNMCFIVFVMINHMSSIVFVIKMIINFDVVN